MLQEGHTDDVFAGRIVYLLWAVVNMEMVVRGNYVLVWKMLRVMRRVILRYRCHFEAPMRIGAQSHWVAE